MSTPFDDRVTDKSSFVRALLSKAGFEADAIRNLVGKILDIASREKFETDHPFFDFAATIAKIARLPDMTRDRALSRAENKPDLLLEHCTAKAAPVGAPAAKETPAVLLAGNKTTAPVQERTQSPTAFRNGLSPKKIFNLLGDYIRKNEELPPCTLSFVLTTEFGNVAVHQIEASLQSTKIADMLEIPQIEHISRSIKINSIHTLYQFMLFSGLAKSEKTASGSKLVAVIPPPPALT